MLTPTDTIFVLEGGEVDLKDVKRDLKELLNCALAEFREVPAVGSIKVFESINAIYTPDAVNITVALLLARYSLPFCAAINLKEAEVALAAVVTAITGLDNASS